MNIYFDNSATTKPYEEVIGTMADIMRNYYGNPSSIYSQGEKSKEKLNECREVIAGTLNAQKEEILFTSGGSESNNFLIKGFAKPGVHIITSSIEHSSILNTCRELEAAGVEVTYLKVDRNGRVNIEELSKCIKSNTELVSLMHVNNEIGVLQDIEAFGTLIKDINPNIKFHVDAVQSYGKIEIDVKKAKIDLLSASGHKIHGPRGAGIAYVRNGLSPKPLISGGGQENNLRSGTENLAAIAGMAKAAEIMTAKMRKNYEKTAELKAYFAERISAVDGIKINTDIGTGFSPYIINISAVGIKSGKILFYLDEREIYLSKGSACSARKLKESHVLKAINLEEDCIKGSLRISFCEDNTKAEVDCVIGAIRECMEHLKNTCI